MYTGEIQYAYVSGSGIPIQQDLTKVKNERKIPDMKKLFALLMAALMVVALSFVSALIPTILLKKIKPVDIIKAKE